MFRVFTIAIFISFISCQKSDVRVLKIGHGLDINHSVHKAMVSMGDDLEKLSGGLMQAEIYANQQLGTERQCLELLQIGSLDITKVSVGVLENFAPKMKVLGLPYVFKDKEHSFAVLDGPIGQDLLEDGAKYWLRGLGFYDAGSRSFYTKEKPVLKPADLEGLKIRVMESVTAMNMVRSLGGSPTPISWGEIYTSLQQGVVDGAENNPPSFYLSKHYEVCKYYSLDEHTMLPDALVISTHTWHDLNTQEKGWLETAVKSSIDYQRELWAEAEEHALTEGEKAGVEILRPDKSLFEAKMEAMMEGYKENAIMYDLIEKIKEVGYE